MTHVRAGWRGGVMTVVGRWWARQTFRPRLFVLACPQTALLLEFSSVIGSRSRDPPHDCQESRSCLLNLSAATLTRPDPI